MYYLLFSLKVGIELVSRDYDMDSSTPFRKVDVVSLVPVHKVKIRNTRVCGCSFSLQNRRQEKERWRA